jgi:hypothetical protein
MTQEFSSNFARECSLQEFKDHVSSRLASSQAPGHLIGDECRFNDSCLVVKIRTGRIHLPKSCNRQLRQIGQG